MTTIIQNNRKKLFILLSFFSFLYANAQTVTTLAGSTSGFADGTGNAAQFDAPVGVAIDAAGIVYVVDRQNHSIRKITDEGVVTTLAGSGNFGFVDGTGTAAQFNYPAGIAVDAAGNVFVADQGNSRIRKITAEGVVTTLAGSTIGFAEGTGTAAQFNNPFAVAVDAAGNVFVADRQNHRIRKITAEGVVTTFAGSTQGYADGIGTAAQFDSPYGVAVDVAGTIFIADTYNNRIRKITAAGVVSTLAGDGNFGFVDGTGTAAQFNYPSGVAVDAAGNVFIADRANHRLRVISAAGVVSTLAGSIQGFADGIGTAAQFLYPYGVALNVAGNVFVGDSGNNKIRKITPALSTSFYQLNSQVSVFPSPASSIIYIKLEDIATAKATIFDMNGRAVQTEGPIDNRSVIDISNLANGIYLVQITTDKGIISKKIVKI